MRKARSARGDWVGPTSFSGCVALWLVGPRLTRLCDDISMEFRRCTVAECHDAEGLVVVIDVLRAFTTAAWAFHRGATEILLTTTVEDAFDLRARLPGSWIMGEVDALPVDGFDLPNSPTAVAAADLRGRTLIHRTTAGTQGACRAAAAERLFAASLVVASATAAHIRALDPQIVTFVETGRRDRDSGDEDAACADFLEALLNGSLPDCEAIQARVRHSKAGRRFADPVRPEFPAADLDYALEIDRFDFAMTAREGSNGLSLTRG